MSLGIFVSRNAWRKMKDIIKFSPISKGFLYYVTSGGCNGFNFNLELLDEKKHTELCGSKPLIIKNEDGIMQMAGLTQKTLKSLDGRKLNSLSFLLSWFK